MGVEWSDGAPPSLYLSTARDEVLAALLDATQVTSLPRICSFLPLNRSQELQHIVRHEKITRAFLF